MSSLLNRICSFLRPSQSPLEVQLQMVSITGRVAYCASCLETVFAIKQLHESELEALLACLWDFTSNPDLSNWEEHIVEFLPEVVAEDSDRELNLLCQQQAENLKKIYASLPASLLRCIDSAIEVGRGNLYAGIVDHSEYTLAPTMQVVRYMLLEGYPLPSINNFLRSPFSEQNMHGWGVRVDRTFFQ
ncbi:hypothetical protein K3G63_03710 [Hymenobacter sp. HSC-4F20]|uniref:hypothetical protein n=1 Tax=Hymenobacter sp. HSC-4F20 TaxID=2864135 RepID=UPI001C73559B|nr:hypothetical protein [Hymenobacter sp. HSC-4F20]MBX0289527.1 hypothetical protein [Hymenobacter sp. HSC-4F20]